MHPASYHFGRCAGRCSSKKTSTVNTATPETTTSSTEDVVGRISNFSEIPKTSLSQLSDFTDDVDSTKVEALDSAPVSPESPPADIWNQSNHYMGINRSFYKNHCDRWDNLSEHHQCRLSICFKITTTSIILSTNPCVPQSADKSTY